MLSYTHSLPYGCSDNHIWLSVHPAPYSDRRTYRYRRISMSGGIIAFPIRVCHGLDSNILDKLLT